MNYRYAFYLIAALLLVPVATSTAQPIGTPPAAKPSNTTGLFVQGHLNGSGLTVEDADPERGSGFGLKLGYGVSPLVTLYAGMDVAVMETEDPLAPSAPDEEYGFGHFDLGVQLNIGGERQALVPYIDAAFSGQAAVFDVDGEELVFSGSGFSVGGGLKYFVSEVLALDGGVQMTFGNFDEAEMGSQVERIEMESTSTRVYFGLSLYPFR